MLYGRLRAEYSRKFQVVSYKVGILASCLYKAYMRRRGHVLEICASPRTLNPKPLEATPKTHKLTSAVGPGSQ